MENNNDLHEYYYIQYQKIQEYKWLESEKAGRDLGQKAVIDWIFKYARKFSEEWER